MITDRLNSDWELIFADDERESNPTTFKFLQMAHAWKNSQAKKTGAGGGTAAAMPGFTPATAVSAGKKTAGEEDPDATSDVASSHGGD